jgi:hypothetical protein
MDCTQSRDLDSVIFETLFPSSRWYGQATKIADLQLLTTCRHIVVVWSTAIRIEVLSRREDGSWGRSADA